MRTKTMGPFYDHQVGRFERPDPVRDRDILLARARRARAEAIADMFGALYRGVKASANAVTRFVRYAGAGAALKPPHGELHHHGPARLTGGCN
jgi:hypothetical protein